MIDITTFVWHAVEFTCMIAIIANVLHTFGLIGTRRRKDLPSTLGDTIKGTNNILRTVSDITKQVNQVVNGPPEAKEAEGEN
ncbi:MAG: hypothetical protein ACMG6E_01935 [Candidatus Roizmanbacteria bacterium]